MKGASKILGTEKVQEGIDYALEKVCDVGAKSLFKDVEEMCHSGVHQYAPDFFNVTTKHILNRERMCTEILELCSEPHVKQLDLHEVVDGILATKPGFLEGDDFIDNLYKQIGTDTSEREIIKAVHISDVHLDMLYAPGFLEGDDFIDNLYKQIG